MGEELERRWEAALEQLRQMNENYHHFQQTPQPETIPPILRELFQEISTRLPKLWPALSNAQKKELLRSLIQQVIIRHPMPDQIAVRVVWISGCFTDHTGLTPIQREKDVSRYEQMVARIQELWQLGYNDEQMAETLTLEGFHSARSPYVTADGVMKIRLARNWHLLVVASLSSGPMPVLTLKFAEMKPSDKEPNVTAHSVAPMTLPPRVCASTNGRMSTPSSKTRAGNPR